MLTCISWFTIFCSDSWTQSSFYGWNIGILILAWINIRVCEKLLASQMLQIGKLAMAAVFLAWCLLNTREERFAWIDFLNKFRSNCKISHFMNFCFLNSLQQSESDLQMGYTNALSTVLVLISLNSYSREKIYWVVTNAGHSTLLLLIYLEVVFSLIILIWLLC